MKQRYQSIILFTILLIVLVLVLIWASGRLVTSIQQTPTEAWDAPAIQVITPTSSPTPGWWNKILPPTQSPPPIPP